MKISANEIRVGMLLEYKSDLWEVLKTQHVKPGKGGAFAQVEMKSVNKNTKLNERFRSSETVEKAAVEEEKFTFLYKDDNDYFFMNPKSFDQSKTKKTRYVASIKILNKVKKFTKTPTVAIGGINALNYKNLLLNNANFLAISGYIWKNKKYKPLQAINKLK